MRHNEPDTQVLFIHSLLQRVSFCLVQCNKADYKSIYSFLLCSVKKCAFYLVHRTDSQEVKWTRLQSFIYSSQRVSLPLGAANPIQGATRLHIQSLLQRVCLPLGATNPTASSFIQSLLQRACLLVGATNPTCRCNEPDSKFIYSLPFATCVPPTSPILIFFLQRVWYIEPDSKFIYSIPSAGSLLASWCVEPDSKFIYSILSAKCVSSTWCNKTDSIVCALSMHQNAFVHALSIETEFKLIYSPSSATCALQ